jgi:hypothetical protein
MFKRLFAFFSVPAPASPPPAPPPATDQAQMPYQVQLIQEIVSRAMSTAQPNWIEFMVDYHVEEGHSSFANSYLIALGDGIHEKPLPPSDPDDLDLWMRRLRAELARAGAQPFTSCKLHVHANGKFEAKYGYEPVDWDALVLAGWNFPGVTNLH